MKEEDWTQRYEAIMDSIMATKDEEMLLDELAVAAGRILGHSIKIPTIDYWCKNMVEKGYLCRQNRSYKKATGKHRETKRYVYFVNPPYDRMRMDGSPRFPEQEGPKYGMLPREAFGKAREGTIGAVAEIKVETPREEPKAEPVKEEPKNEVFEQAMREAVEEMTRPENEPAAVAESVQEAPEERPKERRPRAKKAKANQKMAFAQALEAMYNGKKVVSEVSNTVYSVKESGGMRGVFSNNSGKPILMFPPEEMAGLWHEQEDPCMCPWCGSRMTVKRSRLAGNDERYMCECTNGDCLAAGPKLKTIDDAIMAFNRVAKIAGKVKE